MSLLNAQTAEGTRATLGRRARARPVRAGDRKGQERRPPQQRPAQNSLCTTQMQGAESTSDPPRAPWRCGSSSKIMQDINPLQETHRTSGRMNNPKLPRGPILGPPQCNRLRGPTCQFLPHHLTAASRRGRQDQPTGPSFKRCVLPTPGLRAKDLCLTQLEGGRPGQRERGRLAPPRGHGSWDSGLWPEGPEVTVSGRENEGGRTGPREDSSHSGHVPQSSCSWSSDAAPAWVPRDSRTCSLCF